MTATQTDLDPTQTRSVLIGTAGHIDHGKTRLVGQLTGVNTDRLPEEKARGISIDLGFAHIADGDLRIGVVDVPGHERFVRNMFAGATGINVAVLVVAADDGVMPQTREHLEIMDLLGIPTGLIALTKIDLVDEDLVELAKLDIEEAVAGTFLEDAPVIPVSSETGKGIDELRQRLLETCREISLPESLPLFRLAIDRVFSITGHGTVVTGSVLSGDVQVGTSLDLWPEGRSVRVRSVERHGEQTEEAGSRQRTAINLAGVKHEEVSRGCELATAGYLQTTRRLLVDLRVLTSSPMTLKDRVEVNLHIGTREVETRVILKGRRLEPGQRGYAELRLSAPIVAAFGQRFILRRVSPAVTIGGGRILDPAIPDLLRIRDIETLAGNLDSDSAADRLSVYLGQRDSIRSADLTIASAVGLMPDELDEQLTQLREVGSIVKLGERDRTFEIHIDRLEALGRSVLRTIREEVVRHQPRRSLPKPTLLTACRDITSQQILEAVIAWLLLVLAAARPDLSFPHTAGETADVCLVHSPERVLPGRVLIELTRNDRVVGGLTRRCAEQAAAFYRIAVEGECLLTTAATAELVKLAENAYRDVNIAFANELSAVCDKMGIDVWEAVRLANHHPRVDILQPGPGVGGHCIAVDPWFIVSSAPDDTPLIRAARGVNDGKPGRVVEAVKSAIAGKDRPTVSCLGLAYKADIDDLRESPAVEITRALAWQAAGQVLVVEPHIDTLPDALADLPQLKLTDLDTALDDADVIVLLTDHTVFRASPPTPRAGQVVIDTRGAWRK